MGNANRAIDKLAKASRGKITFQPLPEPDIDEWIEKAVPKEVGVPAPKAPALVVRTSMDANQAIVDPT